MQTPRYALVAYVRDPAGEFVERLRQELHPDHTHLPAHLTILPPRCLLGDELAALELLEEVCSHADPFEITLGEVESFVPVTPTVFIRVAHAGYCARRSRTNGLIWRGFRWAAAWCRALRVRECVAHRARR